MKENALAYFTYLNKDVDEVENFAEDKLADVRIVSPEVTGEIVDHLESILFKNFAFVAGATTK